MMQLLDSNSDGSLSPDEFDTFQKQVKWFSYFGFDLGQIWKVAC
jgi:hypothetical protein